MPVPVEATIGFAQGVARYFSPSRSPHYAVVVAACFALVLSCEKIDAGMYWLSVIIPAGLVLVTSLALAFATPAVFSDEEHEDQLRFVRSISISTATIWLVVIVREIEGDDEVFAIAYAACVVQAIIFLLYAAAKNYSAESFRRINLVQLALITTALLSGASSALMMRSGVELPPEPERAYEIAATLHRYWVVAQGLYLLWGICIAYWIRHLIRLISTPTAAEVAIASAAMTPAASEARQLPG